MLKNNKFKFRLRPRRKDVTTTLGHPPGTLIHVGEKKGAKVKITLFDYDASGFQEKTLDSIEDCFPYRDKATVTWINIDGINDVGIIEKIDDHFGIHPLVLEDIVNTDQRPKIDDYEEYLFIVIKMIFLDQAIGEIKAEQVSMVVGSNYVISFQETEGDVFNYIRDRIRQGKGRIRKYGADYLAYSLLDAVVDGYFLVLEKLDDKIEELEERLLIETDNQLAHGIHLFKRDCIFLRKQIWPLREVIARLLRGESKLIKKATGIYLRDLYDHAIQAIDTIESFRDMLSGMHDVYLSVLSNRMNEIMKVLTIFSAIFIPLTFLTGVYGMNFEFMPELHWRWAYFCLWGLIFLVTGVMIIFFKRKRWM